MDLPAVTPELILVLVGPALVSSAIALGALFAWRRAVRGAPFLFFVALSGFVMSVLWILLALRIEAIEKR